MTGSANDYTKKMGLKFRLPAFALPRWPPSAGPLEGRHILIYLYIYILIYCLTYIRIFMYMSLYAYIQMTIDPQPIRNLV